MYRFVGKYKQFWQLDIQPTIKLNYRCEENPPGSGNFKCDVTKDSDKNLDKVNKLRLKDAKSQLKEIKARPWQSKKDPSLAGLALDVLWSIDDQNVLTALDRKEVIVKQGIMLDTLANGALDCGKGKNVGLGKLREAVNLNAPGRPFSLNQLPGRAAKISVKHRVDGDAVYADVNGVAALV